MVTEIKSIEGYTINTTPQTVAVEYKDQTVTVQYESTTIENTRQKADVSVVRRTLTQRTLLMAASTHFMPEMTSKLCRTGYCDKGYSS